MTRLVNPYQQFLDSSGEPLSSGTLTFTATGTTTPQAIYSDAELTTEQTNPYTLDGSGRVTADIWLDGDYRVVVKDSDGATVYTIDDVSSISTGGGGGTSTETVQGTVYNKFINGSCRVASEGGSITVSGSYQESGVAEIYVKAQGTPTNGTADLVKNANVGTSGYALQVTDLTTGAGGTVDYRFRFNSVDSRDMVNASAVFQCNVLQNTGASKTYTISVYKANAEDDFSGTTLISASSGTSVSDSTDTKIFHPVPDMGDCSNGIEVVVSVACGAVTTKDFYLNDAVFRRGQSAITFEQFPYDRDYAALKFAQQDFYGPPGYLYGLGISNGTDASHDIDIAVGGCRNSDNTSSIELSSALTKQIDQNWAAGSAAGGFPSGLTIANNTWYRVFLIWKTDGTVDAGFDTSATAANLLADATGYTLYRRIGWVLTDGSSNILGFYQDGDDFFWTTIQNNAWTASATAQATTISAPPGSIARVIVNGHYTGAGDRYVIARATDWTDSTPSSSLMTAAMQGDDLNTMHVLPVDSSSQISIRVDNATDVTTRGCCVISWKDRRDQ